MERKRSERTSKRPYRPVKGEGKIGYLDMKPARKKARSIFQKGGIETQAQLKWNSFTGDSPIQHE